MLSPLYKVRDFKVNDRCSHPVSISWVNPAGPTEGAEGEDAEMEGAEATGTSKTAKLFTKDTVLPQGKDITFNRKGPFEVALAYTEPDALPEGAKPSVGTWRVELPAQAEAKKVKVRANLNVHGIAHIAKAELVETEEYEETSKEKREIVPDVTDEAAPAAEPEGEKKESKDAPAEGEQKEGEQKEGEKTEEKKEEKKEPEKKYEWVEVKKMKKRQKVTALDLTPTGVAGMTAAQLQKACDCETALESAMKEIEDTEAAMNDLESYIYDMHDKISESGKLGKFIAPQTREKFQADLSAAEEWLWDHPESPKLEYIEKLQELQVHGKPVAARYDEADSREDAVKELSDTINRYRALAQSPDEKYEHISAENKKKISDECSMVEGWLAQKKQQQADQPTFEDPVLKIDEMATKGKDIAQMSDKILAEPKPKPPTPEPKAEEPKPEEKADPAAEKPAEAEEAPNDPSLDVD